ncbi:MFS transporter [Williamsia deligens]|uniref:MFS transporter n=1 Tax=Williamsia deligens TaxID=321325 RepID=A0ABW3G3D5_9NOCA|nr:MFS transporter [Williamsia deligens]MCP2194100.1 drug resistance transporter, EmrB/QacA subfamily [Williamsia deligens]
MTEPTDTSSSRNGGVALAVICVAQLMVVLDATVVNVALPRIRDDLNFSTANLTWVVTAYSLAFGGLLLFGGRIGDLYGRRKMFMIGVGLFAGASLVGGFATGEAMLIIARAAQGAGGAIAAPTALALLATTFTEPQARARAFGVFAAMAASGGALGLLLGGVLTDYASWRWALFINAPIGLLVLVLAPRVLAESQGSGTKLDLPGAISVTAGMSILVYGLTKAADDGWGSTTTVVTLVIAAALLATFVLVEHRTSHPLMPFHIFADRNRTGSYLIMLFLASALFTTFYFMAQYLQNVHGWTPFETGLGFLPMPSTIMFMSIVVVRRLIPRIGVRPFLTIGPILAIAAMVSFTQLGVNSSYWPFLGCLLLLGVGMGCSFVPLTMTAVNGVAPHETGLASALLNTGQQVGGAIGLAVFGTVFAHAAASRGADLGPAARTAAGQAEIFVAGQQHAFQAAIVVTALALIASLALIRVNKVGAASAPAAEPALTE